MVESDPCPTVLAEVPVRALLAMGNLALPALVFKREVFVGLVTTVAIGFISTVGASFKQTLLAETLVGKEVISIASQT